MKPNTSELDTFTRAYIECALWSSIDGANDSGGEPLDRNYSAADLAAEALAKCVAACAEFQRRHAAAIGTESAQAGHDFWLTRNRHGAGFLDGNWSGYCDGLGNDAKGLPYASAGDALTDAAHAAGECSLYVGDDGQIYLSA